MFSQNQGVSGLDRICELEFPLYRETNNRVFIFVQHRSFPTLKDMAFTIIGKHVNISHNITTCKSIRGEIVCIIFDIIDKT